jgi:hypothetical protein
MSFIIKVDDYLTIAKRDHELLLAIKLIFLFAIHEGVGHQPCYINNNIYDFSGYNINYINNQNSLTRVHLSLYSPPSFSNASILVIFPIVNNLK